MSDISCSSADSTDLASTVLNRTAEGAGSLITTIDNAGVAQIYTGETVTYTTSITYFTRTQVITLTVTASFTT